MSFTSIASGDAFKAVSPTCVGPEAYISEEKGLFKKKNAKLSPRVNICFRYEMKSRTHYKIFKVDLLYTNKNIKTNVPFI